MLVSLGGGGLWTALTRPLPVASPQKDDCLEGVLSNVSAAGLSSSKSDFRAALEGRMPMAIACVQRYTEKGCGGP